MGRAIREDEVRVNINSISVGKDIYRQVKRVNNAWRAEIGYGYSGGISLSFTDNTNVGYPVHLSSSGNYYVIDVKLTRNYIGSYIGIVNRHIINCNNHE